MKKIEEFVAKMCATVPEEISLKKTEMSKLEKMVQNFVIFIAECRNSKSIADSLMVSEQRLEILSTELLMLESAHRKIFKTPPIEWIYDRAANVKECLNSKLSSRRYCCENIWAKLFEACNPRYRETVFAGNFPSAALSTV